MARLVVFRGDARDSKSLDQLPVRIGRGPQNDIVLEDPVKERIETTRRDPSRERPHHARRSEERQRYLGCRVSSVARRAQTKCRCQHRPVPPPARNRRSGHHRCRLRDEGQHASGCAVSPTCPTYCPHAPKQEAGYAGRPGPNGRPVSLRDWRARPSSPLLFSFSRRLRPWTLPGIDQPDRGAKSQIGQGLCTEALAQHIDPALARFAGNTDLLALKRQAEGVPTATFHQSRRTQCGHP